MGDYFNTVHGLEYALRHFVVALEWDQSKYQIKVLNLATPTIWRMDILNILL